MNAARKFEWLGFFLIFGCLLWSFKPDPQSFYQFNGDDVRYMRYAVSLHEQRVFGLAENPGEPAKPGNANAPLYPVFIAGVMALDAAFADSLKCIVDSETGTERSTCQQNFENFYIAQLLLALMCLFMIYQITIHFSSSKIAAWLAALLALGSGIFTEFSYLFMTEILILPVFASLILVCLFFCQKQKLLWIGVMGILLAVLALVRPSYLYLFYGFVLFFTVQALLSRDRKAVLRLLCLIVGFATIAAPWALRNKAQFDSYTLTSGGYAEAILIQRINYNQMRWPEIGVAMIYWLPDFGDSLARKLFPSELHNKLGWGESSYYAQQYQETVEQLSRELGGKDKILAHLVKEELLTLKHVAVSIPLALRGTFIAKYWGLAGFIAFIVLLIQTTRKKDYRLCVMALPLFYMVAFHAGLSVSIPRYNLALVTLYALSMAWYINLYGTRLVQKIRS